MEWRCSLFCSESCSKRPQREYAAGMGFAAFHPPLANWLKSWHAEAPRSMLARSNPGSDPAFDAFDLPEPFWLRTAVPADPTTSTAAASAHSTAAQRNRRDFMAQ